MQALRSRLPRHLPVLIFLAALAWIALRRPDADEAADPRLLRREFMTMGTLVELSVYLPASMPREQAEAAVRQVESGLERFNAQWSAVDGELARLNRKLAAGERIEVPPPLQPLFARAEEISRQSGRLFDPRIGALVKLWGFDDESHYRSEPPPPSGIQRVVSSLQNAPAYVPGEPYGPAPAVQWDFGAIAKGYAVDQAVAALKRAGLADAIVNAGGNLRAAGRHGEHPWKIGIRRPRPTESQNILATLETRGDEAVLTSGDYERYFEYQGRRYCHILDPRTGTPADSLQSVTVVSSDAALADAAGTALFVAGGGHWRELAQQLGLEQVLVVDATGEVWVTAKLAPRLQFAVGVTPHLLP